VKNDRSGPGPVEELELEVEVEVVAVPPNFHSMLSSARLAPLCSWLGV